MSSPTLLRSIGRWDLTATIVNSVIGSAIFGLPATVAALTGAWSPLTVVVAGLCILPIVLCHAEVGSRFSEAGGPYLYARESFGAGVGFHVGWLMLWTRLLSGAAVLNVLVTYLGALVPWVATGTGRTVTMVVAMLVVTAINVRGVRQASWTVNAFTIAKLLPLVLVAVVGLVRLDTDVLATQAVPAPDWTEALLLLVFAYGGFEGAVSASGEMTRPREDLAAALVTGMAGVALVYATVQLAVVGMLPDAAASKAPVADALAAGIGPSGRAIGALAAAISAYGWLTGFALIVPRVPYAMALRGELPAAFGRVHATFRTPHVSIVVFSLVVLLMGLYGTFAYTATLSAIGRLVVFATTCAALVRLRRAGGPPAGWTLRAGPLFAALGIAFTAWMLATRSFAQAWPLAVIVVLGAAAKWASAREARQD